MLKKHVAVWFFSAAILVGAFWFGLSRFEIAYIEAGSQTASIFAPEEAVFGLNEEELADLVKPSIVRIVRHVKGEASIPDFDIDLKTLTVTLNPKKPPTKIPLDQYATGSGFVINPDGYILTNAHVVSDETTKFAVIKPIVEFKVFVAAMGLSKDEATKIITEEASSATFGMKIFNLIREKSTFTFEKTLTVINPSSKKEKLEDLAADGFAAKIVRVNDKFIEDDRDAGLIKIEEKDMPSLLFGGSKSLAIGRRIYVFGFPHTGEVSKKDLLEPTFTQGVISAIKDSKKKDFNILQTDAKVSQGSSGGPLFNEKGEVLGLVTFQTNPSEQQTGDNFAFAIPIEIAKATAVSATTMNKIGNYGEHFLAGLNLLKNRRCARALEEFSLAENSNKSFEVKSHLNGYIAKCDDMIASGQSIDTVVNEIYEWVKSVGITTWAMIGGSIILVIVLIFVVIKLMKRMRKEEVELRDLENKLETNGNPVSQQPPVWINPLQTRSIETKPIQTQPAETKPIQTQPAPVQPRSVPIQVLKMQKTAEPLLVAEKPAVSLNHELLQYVAAAKKAGMTDPVIFAELKNVGWPESDISAALSNL